MSVPSRRRSSRAPRVVGCAVATGEPPRATAVATGPQEEAAAATAVATAVTSASPVPALTAGDRAAMVEIPDDDAPPPGWGQWENWPTPAPQPAAGVLVMREDGCVMPRCPTHGAEASSSRAGPPAPDVAFAHPEQERGHTGVPPAHFDEAQAEQALWQEFRDHSASLNNTMNEALRIHGGPSWRIFQVCIFRQIWSILPCPLRARASPDFVFPHALAIDDRS
jgi:hypothetical protein